jgi:hypothetical protein
MQRAGPPDTLVTQLVTVVVLLLLLLNSGCSHDCWYQFNTFCTIML